MSEKIAFQLSDLHVSYGKKEILHGLNVKMQTGAIGLLGPNGAGKSTLLKTLMGFLAPSKGSAEVFGYNSTAYGAQVRRIIGYMPEEDCYIPGMSGVEFVSYFAQLSGLPPKEAMLRAHVVLNYCGLGEARYRKVDTYSTGMKQRAKLAQALVHDPDLLLLDEPTNGLDPQGRQDMLDLINDITHNKDISVILSSHLLPDVEKVCDQVFVLFQGRVATAGQIHELKQLAQISFEVRIKGNAEQFAAALQAQGGECTAKRDGLLRVKFAENLGTETIFTAARNSGVQVRQLAREEMTLQEVFSTAIEQV
jgi:ABC-2 type transport system ATP-binding protein